MNEVRSRTATPVNHTDQRFLDALWSEKLKAQERRHSLIQRKLAWVTGLLAVGAIEFPFQIGSLLVLYLVPAIALVFDLYILGEHFGIRRMGVYIAKTYTTTPDGEWEEWLATRRDPLSRIALPASTGIVFAGAFALLYAILSSIKTETGSGVGPAFWTCVVGMGVFFLLTHTTAARRVAGLDVEFSEGDAESAPGNEADSGAVENP